jgi:membrane-bound lytic murein transglycosylase D
VVSDTVSVDYAVDLRLVADVTGATLAEIVGLNPSLLRMTTPQDADFDLHVPVGMHDVFLKRIAEIPEGKRTSWRFHIVEPGESLESIASSFHDRAAEIATANALQADAAIVSGDELVVPVTAAVTLPHPLRYITRVGDTLVTIADRFNVSVEDLRRWNHLSSSRVGAKRTLYVTEPVHLAPVTHVRTKRQRMASGAVPSGQAHALQPAKTAAHGAPRKKSASRKKAVASR